MQIRMTGRWLVSTSAVIMLAHAVPGHAQFGGVVYDPTASYHAITSIYNENKQIIQGEQTNLTLGKQLLNDLQMAATDLKTYSTLMSTYNTMLSNLQHFSSKSIWRTAENALMASQVNNGFGETSGLQATLNGTASSAPLAWRIMSLAVAGTSSNFWAGQAVGASDRLAALAGIEALDAVSTQCLGAVGTYNAGRTNGLAANTALQTSQYDTSSFTNSELEQLNLINVSNGQHMHESQGQGQLQACMAAQAAASNLATRNAASQTINDAAYKQSQQAANPTYAGNESGTWTTYF